MKKKAIYLLTALMMTLSAAFASAQERSVSLTITVGTEISDNLEGQPVSLMQTDYSLSYPSLTLNAEGTCTVKVYPGNHRLTVERSGYDTAVKEFSVEQGATTASVSLVLKEKTRAPFALKTKLNHDPATGLNDLTLSWNVEEPVFTDDFESYSPFAINFGDWTGIDADGLATAALVGSYPNRGVMQYAQIINPLTVSPAWWYEYPILRPYDGKQYLGFIRTESGRANDDWLISPVITPGTENILSFMAKAADRYDERFMVYVTTKTEAPGVNDFVRIDPGNYESVDYKGWKEFSYDLTEYTGTPIRFAIRYVGCANTYGAFMLMIDDVFVGQPAANTASAAKARRISRSPANPYEKFNIYLDGTKVGNVEDYTFTFDNISAGSHTLGVEAVYRNAVSELVTLPVEVPAGPYAKVIFKAQAQSALAADHLQITLLNPESGEQITVFTDKGEAVLNSLPHGKYNLHIDKGAYNEYDREIDITGDATIDIALTDCIIDPYNITADVDADAATATLRWNRELGLKDSFEGYDDFATGSFGQWISIDRDQMPVYPIALNNQVISFPGSGTATSATAIAPMVFNPWQTKPAMLPTDPAVTATDGEKSIIFFSPQQAKADKWLISPQVTIREGYQLLFNAKAYSSQYAESMEICISTEGSTNPDDFTVLDSFESLTAESWMRISLPLDDYAGQSVRLGLHYTSTDAFFAQVDEVEICNPDSSGDYIDYGNIVAFEIYIDGEKAGESKTAEFVVKNLTPGEHMAGIKARYLNGSSKLVEYRFAVSAGIEGIGADATDSTPVEMFDLQGRCVSRTDAPGIYIIRQGNKVAKICR